MSCPRWNGEELLGRTILLHAEQGLGDTLQFIRFATLVKGRGARVLVACPDPLIRLVTRCAGVDQVVDWKSTLPESDVHAPLLSLPAILETTLASLPADVPYLSADAATIETWRSLVTRDCLPSVGVLQTARATGLGPSRLESPGRGTARIPWTDGAPSRSLTSLAWPSCPASA